MIEIVLVKNVNFFFGSVCDVVVWVVVVLGWVGRGLGEVI